MKEIDKALHVLSHINTKGSNGWCTGHDHISLAHLWYMSIVDIYTYAKITRNISELYFIFASALLCCLLSRKSRGFMALRSRNDIIDTILQVHNLWPPVKFDLYITITVKPQCCSPYGRECGCYVVVVMDVVVFSGCGYK